VLHADFDQPLYAVATWAQYAALNAKGEATGLWPRMGPLMLHKCAEALALRRAFPNDLSGVYIAEEMDQQGPAELPVAPVPRSFDEMLADAIAADTIEALQAVWREASAAGVLDAPVTNHTTGEVLDFRDYLMGLSHEVKAENDPAADNPVVGTDGAATPESASDEVEKPEVHDAEVVDDDPTTPVIGQL
jgi:hypothetical protein